MENKYRYGWKDDVKSVFETKKGLSEKIITTISKAKKEPKWMLDFRLKSYQAFLKLKIPSEEKWPCVPDLSFIDFDSYTYFKRVSNELKNQWTEVDSTIKNTFDKIGIIEAEKEFLGGVHTQFESEAVYESLQSEISEQGVIFTDTDNALKKYPKLFKKYFNKVVRYDDNKFSALNGAVWSGGSFIYVPKNVKLKKPLQSYFRINSAKTGQFERTLIIVDENAEVNYIEGCTAPTRIKDSLHSAVVEIIVEKGGKCRYTTIQNWSNNILNLVTKRALCKKNARMEWIDGNVGSLITMKYPSIILAGEGASGLTISAAFGGRQMFQDAGAKMIHIAPNTSSKIVAKSIAQDGGRVNYRGLIVQEKQAINSKTQVDCDTLLLDEKSKSDTIPINIVKNNESSLEHEATISSISTKQLFYLMSRGISEEKAREMIILGFFEPFSRELPLEYALELNTMLNEEMEGSIG